MGDKHMKNRNIRILPPVMVAAIILSSSPAHAYEPQTLPVNIQQLTPEQRAALLRQLRESGALEQQLPDTEPGYQFPRITIPAVDTSLGITRVDTTQFFVENPYDFGAVPGEPDSLINLELFGRRMFEMGHGLLDPMGIGPVGADYRLSPGDQIIISMWGEYQEVYDLTINREGFVLIPDVGQLILSNLNIEQAKRRLLQEMTPSYQALDYGRAGATAWLDITLGKLLAIQVFILGDVQAAGAYTINSLSTAFTAIFMAGGPTNKGSLRNVRIIRGSELLAEVDLYHYLLNGGVPDDLSLRNRDIVFIPSIGPKVAVRGSVTRPAIYELGREETLRDVIHNAGGVSASADLSRAQIARILPFDERGSSSIVRVVIDVDLRTVLFDSTAGIPLFDGDVLTVFTVPDDRRNFVVIEGAVWKPGQYEWLDGTTVSQAISAAGGLREEALDSRVDLFRTNPDETVTQIPLVLKDVMAGTEEDISLAPRDRIHVYSIHDVYPQQFIQIHGHVGQPGQYLLHENMALGDLIVRAGGLTKDAWPTSAEVVRLRYGDDGSVTGFERHEVPIDISYAPRGSSRFLLADFDQIFIRQRPQWDVERNVWIAGEVVFPGQYALLRTDERLSELIERAGGLTSVAYAEGTRYYREYEEAGRININLAKALQHRAALDDLIMQPGDSLYVPPKVDFVTVRGAVGYPTSVLYVRGRRPEYYISQAGGIAEGGDRRRTRVTLPNGSIWRPRWFILPDPEVQPGSEIYVPVKTASERDVWEVIRDTSAILSGLTTVLLLVWQINR